MDFELGALGGLRAAWEAGAWTPWIEVLGGYWPSPAVGFEERGGGAARPARIEGLVVLGLSLVR
jgi:hypothetical protein